MDFTQDYSADEFNGEIDFEKLWKINPDVVG